VGERREQRQKIMKRTIFLIAFFFLVNQLGAKEIFVSPCGDDNNSGSKQEPFLSLERAVLETQKYAGKEAVHVWFEEGTYYLDQTLEIGPEMSGSSEFPIVYAAQMGAKVTVKGSLLLKDPKWTPYQDGIYVTDIPEGLVFDQLFVNGERKIRARFPNYDYENPLRGGKGYLNVTGGTNRRYDKWFTYDPQSFTSKEWKHPKTGIVHAFQSHNWGNMQYRIDSVLQDENKVLLGEGGWQLQRAYGIGGNGSKSSMYFIDNIFEELDVAEEWFLDTETNKLYYYPKVGEDIRKAKFELPIVKDLIQLKGTKEHPVQYLTFKGFKFTQSGYTFMDEYEPMARGDWAIHRGAALFLKGAENCTIEDCSFEYLGGNGVFMSEYNRKNSVKSCQFVHTGESAVCFVGSPSAVRFYQTWDDKEIKGKNWLEMRKGMDLKPGPKTPDYPKNCVVENCVMHDFGDVGKQVAGVYIAMSHKIRVSHNSIYNCPRAGICINDGTWGGHIIEFCDIWETVCETGEHGPFNAWGRERQWLGSSGGDRDFQKELTQLDALDNVIVRNNRIANYRKSISAGNWTIDLDDGSSYFEIYNNLSLGSTLKLRDGMARKVHNNITVSAVPLGWHVWPKESEDEIYQNIFVISGAVPGKEEPTNRFIRDVGLPDDMPWSTNHNHNLFWNVNFPENPNILEDKSMKDWQNEGYDLNSKIADPLFVNPKEANYQVKENSPALQLGFKNFPIDKFGHEMTRIVPFGGDFKDEISVSILADARMGKGGSVRYTLDDSEPNAQSPVYTDKIKLQESTCIKSLSFDADGNPIGFVNEAQFTKVDLVEYPNWLATLLAGKFEGDKSVLTLKALKKNVKGALLININDDPDLIDASGGYSYGCYIQSIDKSEGKIWLAAGLSNAWTLQQVNDEKISNISDLEKAMKKHSGENVKVIAVKNYTSKIFKIKLP
jgi:hypothetical protein